EVAATARAIAPPVIHFFTFFMVIKLLSYGRFFEPLVSLFVVFILPLLCGRKMANSVYSVVILFYFATELPFTGSILYNVRNRRCGIWR
ncbi:MAG: hypothetical protein AB7U34_09330, partial [Novosphingobium sp.]